MSYRPRQGALPFRTWGGRRPGAGRKPAGPTAGVPHRRRPLHHGGQPVHVTLRAVRGLPSLRRARLFPALRRGLGAASAATFRVVHYSVQANHVHSSSRPRGRGRSDGGCRGLGIRLAKAINRRLGRRGRVWAERYHGRALRTPREVRHGLVYVLLNGRKHGVIGRGIDPCSSGAWFGGWREGVEPSPEPAPVARPRTWLLSVGWRRTGQIGVDEAAAAPGRRTGRSRVRFKTPRRSATRRVTLEERDVNGRPGKSALCGV